MKVEITGETGPTFVLAYGDNRACIETHSIRNQRKIDIREGIRASRAVPTDRANGLTVFSPVINRLHASISDASLFSIDHSRNVPSRGTVKITIPETQGQPGGSVRVLNDAVIEVSETRQIGATTITSYNIIGSEFVKGTR